MMIEQGKLEPFGVPIDRFCPRDQARIVSMVRDGKTGIAGLCEACTALIDAARPVEPTTAAEHPAPWRLAYTAGPHGPHDILRDEMKLQDANGVPLVWNGEWRGDGVGISPGVRELIRLAPELEAALRDVLDVLDAHRAGAGSAAMHARQAETERRVDVILAALGAVRKATP